jgi:hypothetical protein
MQRNRLVVMAALEAADVSPRVNQHPDASICSSTRTKHLLFPEESKMCFACSEIREKRHLSLKCFVYCRNVPGTIFVF